MATLLQRLDDSEVVRLLRNGAVGVLPTDTIYGIVTSAYNKPAVARLYKAKHRAGKPGTVIAADIDQLIELGIDARYLRRAAALWPNPISVVLPDQPHLSYLDQGKHSLAVRIPLSAPIHKLLRSTGPLLTSSANLTGLPPAISIRQAQEYFGDTVDFYVDGGTLVQLQPSTIVRLTENDELEVLRRGAVDVHKEVE